VFESSGGFDEGLVGGEDWDLSIRIGGGARLPRVGSLIIHDEGRIQLLAAMARKRYYAQSFRAYLRKHPRRAWQQANIVLRPAFARHWRKLVAHPELACGIVVLKSLEALASLYGTVFTKPEGKTRRLANDALDRSGR
jgi:hypothetical protein